jgi:hypothetical protein
MASKDETPWKPNPRSSPPRAVSGAAALAIIGVTWSGWVTGSKATELVRQRVPELVEALTPVFQQSVRCPGTVARTEEGRFVVGSRALRTL